MDTGKRDRGEAGRDRRAGRRLIRALATRRAAPLALTLLLAAAALSPVPAQERVVTGYLRTVDFVSAGGATVRVSGTDRGAEAGEDGRFALSTAERGGGEAETIIISLPGYHSATVPIPRSGDVGTVLLIPLRWRITTGRHAGREVEIDLPGATGSGCANCVSFYGRVLGDENSTLPPGIPTWPPTSFPLDVAFDRENGGRVSAADSIAFWRVVREIEDQFGLRLFRPRPLRDVLANVANDGPGSLLVMIDPRLPNTGWGSSVAQSGDILAGSVRFRNAYNFSRLGASDVVAHEVFHALGFGHTCAWRSVVADVGRCRSSQAPLPTSEDVAHAQLLWRIRNLERESRISDTIDAALRALGVRRPGAADVGQAQQNR